MNKKTIIAMVAFVLYFLVLPAILALIWNIMAVFSGLPLGWCTYEMAFRVMVVGLFVMLALQ